MSSDPTVQAPERSRVGRFTDLVLFAVLISGLFLGTLYLLMPAGPHGGLEPENPLPPLKAAGWLNGEAPTEAELAGKVVVVDFWASWCRPCYIKAPELIKLYKKFRDQDVVFIGLTAEGDEELEDIKLFLRQTGIPWRNGYGAVETAIALKAEALPSVWVVDRNGTIAWNSDSRASLEDAIENALAEK